MSTETLTPVKTENVQDINGNNVDGVVYEERLTPMVSNETAGKPKMPTLVVPEPRKYSQLPDPVSGYGEVPDASIERVSPRTTTPPCPDRPELPSIPGMPWRTAFYPPVQPQYPFLPYSIPGFPFPAFPEQLFFRPFPDHLGARVPHAGLFTPFPFPAGISPFHLPIRHEKMLGLENRNIENEMNIMNSSFDGKVTHAQPDETSAKELPSPEQEQATSLPDVEKRKEKDVMTSKYQCSSCQKHYTTFSGLSKHKQFHCSQDSNKEFSCKYCEKTYVSLGALKMHIRTHTLPCKCKICGKAFSRPWLLQGHIRTHTGEKPFSCVHCLRAFADRSNLRAHLQTHSDVKKYSCKACSKTFSRMSLLLKHEDTCGMVDI